MLRQQIKEEKQLWKTFSSTELTPVTVESVSVSEQIRQLQRVLGYGYSKITWWRRPFLILTGIWLLCLFFMPTLQLSEIASSIYTIVGACLFSTPLVMTKPSSQWLKCIRSLIELSKQSSAEDSIRPLLYVTHMESMFLSINIYALTPKLYERLAQVLIRLTDFTPDENELQLLQRIALKDKRYPEPLRIAAVLTLGDHPERLDKKFWAKLEARLKKERSETFLVAARDVLSQR